MAADQIHLYIGIYSTAQDAEADYADLKLLHGSGHVGAYDAEVISRSADGTVDIYDQGKQTKHGAWTGLAVGAVAGLLFPPSILGAALVGGAGGGLIGHFRKGLTKADTEELGSALASGDVAMVVVGDEKIEWQLERVFSRAGTRFAKQIKADPEAFAQALREAEEQRK